MSEETIETVVEITPTGQKFTAALAAFAVGFAVEHLVKKGVNYGFKALKAKKA